MLRSSFIGFALGVLITIPCLWLVVFAAGAGHGTYAPAKLLFPLAMLAPVFRQSLTTPWIIAAILQFPAYGLILGRMYYSRRFRLSVACVALLHLFVAAISLICTHEAFS
jgi:hypothetical protein